MKFASKTTVILVALLCICNVYAVNFAGTYTCSKGYDTKDGKVNSAASFTITVDLTNSDAKKDRYAYTVKDIGNDIVYTATAISQGNNMAMYFQNIQTPEKHDNGIELIKANLNKAGKIKSIYKIYYEPEYISNGWEICNKVD
jgi:YbbR domain-containing protein